MKNISIFFLFLVHFSLHSFSNEGFYKYGHQSSGTNIFGETGIITVPNAKTASEGSLFFNFSQNSIFKFGALTIAPFDWMEASYFYYRPSDIWWGNPSGRGLYLDKGFSVKFSKNITNNFMLAAGLSDFSGTGLFGREYIVGTYEKDFFRATLGVGFGKFVSNDNGFSNPLKVFSNRFANRQSIYEDYDVGGTLNQNQWFTGDATILGGIELHLPNPLKNFHLKVEYNPYDYNDFSVAQNRGADFNLRSKHSDINFGIGYQVSEIVGISLSYIKGDTFNINFQFGGNFSKNFFKKEVISKKVTSVKKSNIPEIQFHEDLLLNLKSRSIFVQSSEISEDSLIVAISSNKFRNPIKLHQIVGDTAVSVAGKNNLFSELTTVNINVGQELLRINSPIEKIKNQEILPIEDLIYSTSITSGESSKYQEFEFRPTLNFPASFTGIAPALVNHIGDPAQFYYGGIVLRIDNELQLQRNLIIRSELKIDIANNFGDKVDFPDSKLPHVRTDIVQYLQQSDAYISRMQLDYFKKFKSDYYFKFSAGILEDMYNGYGFEFLYKPFYRNFSIGIENFQVKKRQFDRKFKMLDYEVDTHHINLNMYMPKQKILTSLSYGKYLAGDRGYTLDISRILESGFRAGFFFSRTNVSPFLFGEGSFDKGFYFQIPIELFFTNYQSGNINFRLTPLTRDGGQKLQHGNDLIGIMHNTSLNEAKRFWFDL